VTDAVEVFALTQVKVWSWIYAKSTFFLLKLGSEFFGLFEDDPLMFCLHTGREL